MSAARELLARYLRQRRELGEDALFLETLTRGDAISLASGRRPQSCSMARARFRELGTSRTPRAR